MKILFILGKVYPDVDANSKIIDNVAKYLIDNFNSKITYASIRLGQKIKTDKIDSINLVYMQSNIFDIKIYGKDTKIGKFVNRALNKFFCTRLLSRCKVRKSLKDYIVESDFVIYITSPISSLKYVNKKYSNKSFIWAVDPIASNYYCVNDSEVAKLEKKAFEMVNKIFIGDYIYDENLKNKYKYISDKFITTKLPNIANIAEPSIIIEKSNISTDNVTNGESSISNAVKIAKNSEITVGLNSDECYSKCKTQNSNNSALEKSMDCKKIKCVFSGFFYKDIRNPKYFIEFLERIVNKNIEIIIIYGWYSEQTDEFKKFVSKTYDNIKFYYRLPMNEALEYIKNADILINVGNTIANQLPSKILDYINAGKPIVNFYKIDDCPTLDYMAKYPISLNIKETDKINIADVQKFEKFCVDSLNKTVSYDIIKELFYESTVEYVAKLIYDNLK